MFDFIYGLDNTGVIDSDTGDNHVHLLRDAQWLGAILKAKTDGYRKWGGYDEIADDLGTYFESVYAPEVERIFKEEFKKVSWPTIRNSLPIGLG